MPYSPERKDETRRKIIRSAARLFNRRGFSDVTIDEIMGAAGLTHGGFYRHFNSKNELFAEAVRRFLRKEKPEPWEKNQPNCRETGRPIASFIVDAYLSRDHLHDGAGSCPLIGLPSDVARSGKAVKAAYRELAQSMIRGCEIDLNGSREQALVVLALCVGGMVLARAVGDQVLADELRDTVHKHVFMTAGWGNGPSC